MAYQVKKDTKVVVEELELVDQDGVVQKKLTIPVSVSGVASRASAKYLELLKLKKEMDNQQLLEDKAALYDRMCRVIPEIYAAIVGEGNAKELADFYDGDPVEMMVHTLPFLRDVLIPKMRDRAKELQAEAFRKYGRKAKKTGFPWGKR